MQICKEYFLKTVDFDLCTVRMLKKMDDRLFF